MADVYKQSFKQNYTNNIELSIFNCGIERCAPGQTWGPGIRDHYLIHLVLSGKGVFEVGGRTWEVSQGQLFFARPSQLIRYTADEQQPWEYSWVGFNGACAHKLAAQLPFTDDSPVHHTHDPDGMRAALANIYSSRGLQPQDEACCDLPAEQRIIHLQLRKQYRSLFYRLENPYSDTVRSIRIGEYHGYGLKNINRIVQENHGDFYTKKKDGVFTVQVRLNCEN